MSGINLSDSKIGDVAHQANGEGPIESRYLTSLVQPGQPLLPARTIIVFRVQSMPICRAAVRLTSATVTVTITHLLLVAPTEAGRGVRTHLPKVVDLMDTYCAALAADPLLNNTLLEPTHVQVEPGDFTYGHTTYRGCAFRHTWTIQV